MSFAAIVWLASLAIGALVFLAVRSTAKAFAVASVASFIVVYVSLLFVGHPVAGVSIFSIVTAALVTAATVAALRMALRRTRENRNV
jgi:hypothetical protein